MQLKIDCARDCSSSCKCDVHFRESGCTCSRDCTANKKDQLRQSVWADLFLYLIIGISVASAAKKSLKCSMEMYHSLRQLPLKRILSAFLFFIKKQPTSVILSIASEKREQAYEILYLRLPFIRGKPFTVVPNSIKNGVAE